MKSQKTFRLILFVCFKLQPNNAAGDGARNRLRSSYSRGDLELELVCALHRVTKLAEKTGFPSGHCPEACAPTKTREHWHYASVSTNPRGKL